MRHAPKNLPRDKLPPQGKWTTSAWQKANIEVTERCCQLRICETKNCSSGQTPVLFVGKAESKTCDQNLAEERPALILSYSRRLF